MAAARRNEQVFPLPPPLMPVKPKSRGSRSKARFRRRLWVWHRALSLLSVMNSLACGHLRTQTSRRPILSFSCEAQAAIRSTHQWVLKEASASVRKRRDFDLTGAQAVLHLLGDRSDDVYSRPANESPFTLLRAADIDEPGDERCVNMLEALDPEESLSLIHI